MMQNMGLVIRSLFLGVVLLSMSFNGYTQTYADSIAQYRKQYIADLLSDKRSPVKPSQIKGISFYKPDRGYCVWGAINMTPGSVPFMMDTHSGKKKPFRQYGTVTFAIHDTMMTLHIYQSIDVVNGANHENELFIPFNDMTNYDATFGGGRYIDLSVADIKNGMILIDFNKCYNPYCAYAEGYSCPIPPVENRLHIEIPAGERMFTPGL